jgi:hypothetical protein
MLDAKSSYSEGKNKLPLEKKRGFVSGRPFQRCNMSDEWETKSFQAEDGKQRASIVARKDGFYRFIGEKVFEEMGYTYWAPTYWSGLYETAELAETGARSIIPWLGTRSAQT